MPTMQRYLPARLAVLLGVLLALSFTIFLRVHPAHPERVAAPDSASYENSALALLRAGTFSVSEDEPGVPQTVRTPGYPAFLAAVYRVFGVSRGAVVSLQILLSAATVWLAYLMAASLWGEGPAFLSAVLLALDFISLYLPQQLLTDTLFTFLLSVCAAAGLRFTAGGRKSAAWAALCTLSLALATLVRPVSYYLFAPALLFLFFAGRKHGAAKAARSALLAALPWALLVFGWQVRNYRVSGSFEFSQIKAVNLLLYRGAYIISRTERIPLQEAAGRLEAEFGPGKGRPDAAMYARWSEEGERLLLEHPLLAAGETARGLAAIFLVPGETDLLGYLGTGGGKDSGCMGDLLRLSPREYARKWLLRRPGTFAVFLAALLYLAVFYLGAAVSLRRLAAEGGLLSAPHVLLLGLVLYLALVSAGPEAYARFRTPLMPLLAVYSGEGWYRLLIRKKRGG